MCLSDTDNDSQVPVDMYLPIHVFRQCPSLHAVYDYPYTLHIIDKLQVLHVDAVSVCQRPRVQHYYEHCTAIEKTQHRLCRIILSNAANWLCFCLVNIFLIEIAWELSLSCLQSHFFHSEIVSLVR